MKRKYQMLLAWLILAGLSGTFGGCARTLFSESDSYTRARIDRYYDGDSATQTTESRQRASEMGFGFPTGMASQ